MASFQEMLDAALFLIVSTLTIVVFWVAGSPIMDFLSVYVGSFAFTSPVVIQMAGSAQPVFGWWYWLLIIMEIAVFIRTYLIIVTRVDYSTGDSNF
jgi:hypothetical protein